MADRSASTRWKAVHAGSSPLLASRTIEGWQFKAPEGVPLQLLELARLKPRKDRHSHPGDTGRYGAGAIRRLLRRPGSKADNGVEILSRLLLTKNSGVPSAAC